MQPSSLQRLFALSVSYIVPLTEGKIIISRLTLWEDVVCVGETIIIYSLNIFTVSMANFHAEVKWKLLAFQCLMSNEGFQGEKLASKLLKLQSK